MAGLTVGSDSSASIVSMLIREDQQRETSSKSTKSLEAVMK
jgi:hypothetical protein